MKWAIICLITFIIPAASGYVAPPLSKNACHRPYFWYNVLIMKTLIRAITIIFLFLPACSAAAAPPQPQYHAWLPYAAHQPDPCAEKRKPQPHDIPTADAVIQPTDLPEHDLDPGLSGDALTPQLQALGAASAYRVLYWAKDWFTSPLTVYNIVVVFWDEGKATGYMAYLEDKCVELGGEPVMVPPLGDEANACRRGGGVSDIYTVNYRHGNVVSGTGIDGTLATALEYAALSLARVECVCKGDE